MIGFDDYGDFLTKMAKDLYMINHIIFGRDSGNKSSDNKEIVDDTVVTVDGDKFEKVLETKDGIEVFEEV